MRVTTLERQRLSDVLETAVMLLTLTIVAAIVWGMIVPIQLASAFA